MVARIAGDTVTDSGNTAQCLDVDVEHVARRRMFIADHGSGWIKVAESGQIGPCQYPAHSRHRDAKRQGNARVCETLAAQFDHRHRLVLRDSTRRKVRTRRQVVQAGDAVRQIASQPFAYRRLAHAVALRTVADASFVIHDVLDHVDSTCIGRSGILHSAGLPESFVWLEPTSLSGPVRMNNLLKHHT